MAETDAAIAYLHAGTMTLQAYGACPEIRKSD